MGKYFRGRVSRGFISIYSARMILRISSSLLGLFMPIFLYRVFSFNIRSVLIYYLISHLLYALTVAWGCQYLNKIGLRRSLRISIIIGALYYWVFYLLDIGFRAEGYNYQHLGLLLVLSIITITIHRTMYWIPIHTDMAKFTSKLNRAKELSAIEAGTLALGAVMPLVAGYILSRFDYAVLFMIAIIVYFASLIPLVHLPKTRERFSWSYFQTWQELFSHKWRRTTLAYIGDGAETVVGLVIWPIFIWELLKGDYFEVGAISSLIVVVTIILQLTVGRFADKGGRKKMLHWGTILYAFGWIVKIFIFTAFQIFIASTFHSLAKIFTKTPFDALSYEKAADQGHYVDEYSAMHEMAFQLGKALMLVLSLALTAVYSLQWTFVLAALASLALNFIADSKVIKAGRHAG